MRASVLSGNRQALPRIGISVPTDEIPIKKSRHIVRLHQLDAQWQNPNLFAFTKDWDSASFKDYCHFTEEDNEILSTRVADWLSQQV